jgi:1A family penicillin-binding protein
MDRTGKNFAASFFTSLGRPIFKCLLVLTYFLVYVVSFTYKITHTKKRKKNKILFPKIVPKIKLPTLPKFTLPKITPPVLKRGKIKLLKLNLPKLKSFKIKISRPHLPKLTILKSITLPKIPKLGINYKIASLFLGVFFSAIITTYFSFIIFKGLPSPKRLAKEEQSLSTKIYDRNGNLLYKIYREKNRTPVPLSELPVYLVQATLSIEDKDFYHHPGLSVTGIIRATYQNLALGKKIGGSTITQQLIKNTLLTPEKTWRRKIKEAVLALMVEKLYTKDEILEMYLNEVPYGGATYGVEEASLKYFGKHARELSLAEATLLAGLPASPTRFSPFGNNPQLAKERQAVVLRRMVEDGYITEEQRQETLKQSVILAPQRTEIHAPHFVMYVKDLLVQQYGENMVVEGGLEVTTSLDLNVQETVQKIVADEIKKLGNLHITNGAALVTNPKTGEILAMVGSKDYFAKDIDGNVNVTTSQRQPGSSIKPVAYSLALENGFTPATLIDDSPITYRIPGQEPYTPKNYDNSYRGQVSLRSALGSSLNIPAVKILAAFGVNKMVERGREMGITTWDDPSRFGLSLTLGSGEVKMTDMAVVYGVLANNGVRVELNPILEVKTSDDKVLERYSHGRETPAINPGVAFLLTNILSDNSARTPTFGTNSLLYIPNRTVAVKTGTTQNLKDNWTIGYTPTLLTAVWVGNNDSSPMSYVASGVTGASPIWRKTMDALLRDKPPEEFSKPEEIEEVTICQTTGTLTCDGCPSVKKEYFLRGTAPKQACDSSRWLPTPSEDFDKRLKNQIERLLPGRYHIRLREEKESELSD